MGQHHSLVGASFSGAIDVTGLSDKTKRTYAKRKAVLTEEDLRKREENRAQISNNEAAARYRKKKKDTEIQLNEQNEVLKHKVELLLKENTYLKEQFSVIIADKSAEERVNGFFA